MEEENQTVTISSDGLSTLNVSLDPMGAGRDDRSVRYVQNTGEEKRVSNIMFGYNKKGINIANGEFVNDQELVNATMNFINSLSETKVVTCKKTGKHINTSDIQNLVKEVAEKCGNINILGSEQTNHTISSKMEVSAPKKPQNIQKGNIFLGKSIQMPSGKYVNLLEFNIALSEYINSESKVIETEKKDVPITQQVSEPKKVVRINKSFKARILPLIAAGLLSVSVLAGMHIDLNKEAKIPAIDPIVVTQDVERDDYTIECDSIKCHISKGTYDILMNSNLSETKLSLTGNEKITEYGNGSGNVIKASGEHKIYGYAVCKGTETIAYIEDLEGDNVYNSNDGTNFTNAKDFFEHVLKSNPGLNIEDLKISFHFGSSKDTPRLGWVDMKDLIENNKFEAKEGDKNLTFSGSTKDPYNATITKDDGTIVTFSLVDSNGKYYEEGSAVRGSDGEDYVIQSRSHETSKTFITLEQNVKEEPNKEVNMFVVVPAALSAVASFALAGAAVAKAKKENKNAEVSLEEFKTDEEYQEFLKQFKKEKEKYQSKSLFGKLFIKQSKVVRKLSDDQVKELYSILTSKYGNTSSFNLEGDKIIVTKEDGTKLEVSDSVMKEIYPIGKDNEIVARTR